MTPDPQRLQGCLEAQLAEHPEAPGLLATVVAEDGTRWSGAAGVLDRGSGRPLVPEATFRTASVTKSFVASAVWRLVELGRVSARDPMARHLPSRLCEVLRTGGHDPAAITVEQCLRHTSGLPDYAGDEDYGSAVQSDPAHVWTREQQVVWSMERQSPVGSPGTVHHYSDTGYNLLGALLERETGDTMGGALRTLLRFDRLGLRSTWLEVVEPEPAGAGPRAAQYVEEQSIVGVHPSSDLHGGGGLASTTQDLATFFRALLRGEVLHQRSTLDEMLRPTEVGDDPVVSEQGWSAGLYAPLAGRRDWRGHTGYWNVCAAADLSTGAAVSTVVLARGACPSTELAGRLLDV
jgi:D-alanyl-D-alanine carboxypeptidase